MGFGASVDKQVIRKIAAALELSHGRGRLYVSLTGASGVSHRPFTGDSPNPRRARETRRQAMSDLYFLLLGLGVFALMALYARLCARL